jgi:hydroxymethylcytosylglucuronate/cytosylglucuronate synthase
MRATHEEERTLPALVVCGVDFGWGSAGKLSAIGHALLAMCGPQLRIIVVGTGLGRPVLKDLPVVRWEEQVDPEQLPALLAEQRVGAGLVILDPARAIALERAGCPIVYVDSLPYLWTAQDRLPYEVTVYAAQLCHVIPRYAWQPLRRIRRLRWVEGITPGWASSRRRVQPGLAVVSLGGLHAPGRAAGAYEQLVLAPTLQALAAAGFTTIEVCGNVGALAEQVAHLACPALVRSAARAHSEFLNLLDRATLLVCSPGLTTLIEAGQRCLPTVCLPPQNVSQILNSARFAEQVHPGSRVDWPACVLDMETIEQARPLGEEAAVARLYEALAAATRQRAQIWRDLQEAVGAAIGQAQVYRSWDGLVTGMGMRGAQQVASMLYELLHRRQL